ncbi:hypothetical protein BJP34_16830 [Moorena producens PAL-8-15-08-1]|uniref:eCIS core domain-containing protein n=1 Tax=Moorena producens PAL-8-15-08-1 TaxID=1458985 RepID=A0A1D8TTC2_9CYAN|nr:DUF4157 domain-containing protein [Moorena producens]AOX00889.1 hypothetical protein BJP34_16830 [Moorena producens PAL-8-15-08-1]
MTREYDVRRSSKSPQKNSDNWILQRSAVRQLPAKTLTSQTETVAGDRSGIQLDLMQIPVHNQDPLVVQPKLMAASVGNHNSVCQLKEHQQNVADVGDTPVQQVAEVEAPNNTGLPDRLKIGIENLSGYSMNDVRVHRSSAKPARLQATAYAQGTEIHVGPGQEKHLPHEAWHVVQQKQGRVKATQQFKGVAINDNAALEREADQMGKTALQYDYRNYGFRDNQDINVSSQTGYSKVAQLQGGHEKIEEIRSRVSPWATSQPDCLKVSKQLWNNLKLSPIEGQTELKLAKYVWWRGKGNDNEGRMITTDGKREILTGQSHVAVKATIDSSTYIIDVTIGQFMKPKEAEVFVGTVEQWEKRLMDLTDGRQDTIERNAVIAEGFECFAKPDKPLDEARYVDELTAYKLNQVPEQKKYGDKKSSKTGWLKSKLPFFKKS